VSKVEFVGNKQITAKTLKRVSRRPVAWGPLRWFRRIRYDREKLEITRITISRFYMDKGFLDARVDSPEINKDENGNLVIKFNITEGVEYRFGEMSVSGVTLFPEAEIRRFIRTRTGDVASTLTIERSVHAIEDYYGSLGYMNASVNTVLDPNASKKNVNIVYSVTEGKRASIRNVLIRGNTRTKDKVIRRELLVYPGDIYNNVKVRRSESVIRNLGHFSFVRSYPVNTPVNEEKDIIFEVEEKRTGQFMFGAGLSSIDNVMGYVEVSQGNFDISGWPFTGGGQKLKLRGQIGGRRQLYELSFVEPWFLDRKLSFGADLYGTSVSYSEYDVERVGGAVSIGRNLPGPYRMKVRYGLEEVSISDVAATNEYTNLETGEPFFFDTEENRTESSLRLGLTRNTCNNFFAPTRGTYMNIFGSVSGGLLGLDTDLYRLGGRVSHYVPLWFRHVLSLKARVEVVEEYDDTEEIPLSSRLFIGGGKTLRGYDYRDVGPLVESVVDSSKHKPIGGRSMIMGKAEYLIPLVDGIRWAFFYDTGNVWTDAYDFRLDNMASSAGVGIRLDLPGFPIRFDWGWPIYYDDRYFSSEDDVKEIEESFSFWIGYDY
ncbi:outer membrane protein assembly factor BamA, partial [Verrucomicrobiota bacterium]